MEDLAKEIMNLAHEISILFRVFLTCRTILLHVAGGFTFPLNEGVLLNEKNYRIFSVTLQGMFVLFECGVMQMTKPFNII
jgi:hypothetical protein